MILHTLEDIVRSDTVRLERSEGGGFDAEFAWRDSYEAEQHVHHESQEGSRGLENISPVTLWRKMKEYGLRP